LLEELKSTQEKLVTQSKLAALGALTAGIAHEIKNQLNFVNNFSSVSLELVDEAMDEVAMVQAQRQKETMGKETHDPVETHGRASLQEDAAPDVQTQSIASPHGRASLHDQDASVPDVQTKGLASLTEILSDIKSNLTKIHEHGSRADGIVKSMLQHSRGGSGKMEPADLNALVTEFTNLAYHGMRASKNPFEAEITLDLDETIGEIPLVYEDFSRVIVNICSNAFDAMRGSVINDQGSMIGDREIDGAYLPHLKVRTKSEGGRVLIEIEDNGPGIPDDIKDKILQPFFTTKKGTQGTGLGLSITHDIVKAHGGELSIHSKLGIGSRFVISLPSV
jgi:signal transduction histidine kinase